MYDESLYKILPDELIKDIGIYAGFQHVREIRLRTGRLPAAICDNGEHRGAVPVDEHMITRILSIATNYSSYAYESCMANGFLTIKGGHRIGLGLRRESAAGCIHTYGRLSLRCLFLWGRSCRSPGGGLCSISCSRTYRRFFERTVPCRRWRSFHPPCRAGCRSGHYSRLHGVLVPNIASPGTKCRSCMHLDRSRGCHSLRRQRR